MLASISPKLPMRNKSATRDYYINSLGFKPLGETDYPEYLMLVKDQIELHFFTFKALKPKKNYGQVYIRVENIDAYYNALVAANVAIHPNGALSTKPWGQREFALLDPDSNLLTFGEDV